MAYKLGGDWRSVLALPDDESLLAQVVIGEAQRMHVQELQSMADRMATQTANSIGPMLSKTLAAIAKQMR